MFCLFVFSFVFSFCFCVLFLLLFFPEGRWASRQQGHPRGHQQVSVTSTTVLTESRHAPCLVPLLLPRQGVRGNRFNPRASFFSFSQRSSFTQTCERTRICPLGALMKRWRGECFAPLGDQGIQGSRDLGTWAAGASQRAAAAERNQYNRPHREPACPLPCTSTTS